MEPGRSVRVGRKPPADFLVADDSHMSGIHFVLECDDKGCVLCDLPVATACWSTVAGCSAIICI
jgi:hypothetical protein